MSIKLTVSEIAGITGGQLLCGDPGTIIDNIQYDSRAVRENTLFVPIKGARVDAHMFIDECLKKAAATLTMYDAPEGAEKPYIKVDNTLAALQKLAADYRRRFSLHLVGVTGSVGKTSTKEMIAAALSKGFDLMKTEGNKNSQIGMPMTMFEIENKNEVAVIEMGMSEFGEMERLCDVAAPDIAVMTNIGTAHIENLGTQENIMSEKFKITNHFKKNSVLFLNGDDKLLKTLHGKQPFRTVTFGIESDNDYYADNIQTVGLSCEFVCHSKNGDRRFTVPTLGIHGVRNALAAIAVAEYLGLDDETIQKGLDTYKNAPMRQQLHDMGNYILIDDSYNASPEAMVSSIDVLKSVSKGRTIAVLADMLELGEKGEQLHYNVGQYAAKAGIDTVITVGTLAKSIAKGAKDGGTTDTSSFMSNDEAFVFLQSKLSDGCAVLIKGSRGMHTDEIVSKLLSNSNK